MAIVRTVWVWPPSGFPDQRWCLQPDADAFAKVSRAICDRYSECLPTLGLQHKVSSLQIMAESGWTDSHPVGDSPWVFFNGERRPEGPETAHAAMPSGFADWPLSTQKRMVLDVVHGLMMTMAVSRGIARADRLETARRHVEEHEFGYTWDGPWLAAPKGTLAARCRYRLNPDGFGTAVLEVARMQEGVPEVIGKTGEHRAWTTSKSFRRSAKTLRWHGPTQVSVVPYVAFFASPAPTLQVEITAASTIVETAPPACSNG